MSVYFRFKKKYKEKEIQLIYALGQAAAGMKA
jgi:hypothetical protein